MYSIVSSDVSSEDGKALCDSAGIFSAASRQVKGQVAEPISLLGRYSKVPGASDDHNSLAAFFSDGLDTWRILSDLDSNHKGFMIP